MALSLWIHYFHRQGTFVVENHYESTMSIANSLYIILYITKKPNFSNFALPIVEKWTHEIPKIDFEKFQDPATILEHKTNLGVNTLTIPNVHWWGWVKWLMGYWQVKLYQSQVNLLEKICFDFEPNPVRVDKSGLHLKKSTFRFFSLAAYDSPL